MEWLKDLRRISLRRRMVRIAVLAALAAGVFVYFRCWSLLGMLSPKTLSELTPETMEGAFVEDDIDWFYSPYLEERYGEDWETGKRTGVQYLIDFDEVYYMGLAVHGKQMEEADAMMEAVDDFYDGGLAAEDVPVLHVRGTVRAMDEQEAYYFLDFAGGEPELEALLLTYCLDADRIAGRSILAEAAALAGALALLAAALFPLVKAQRGGYQKQVVEKLREAGPLEAEAERAARFYERTEPISGVRLGTEYIFFQNGADSVLLRPWDLAWAYQNTTQHRTNGVPTGKTYALVLRTMDGGQYSLPMKEAEIQRLLGAMREALPRTSLGYTPEVEKIYREHREVFAERWKDRDRVRFSR